MRCRTICHFLPHLDLAPVDDLAKSKTFQTLKKVRIATEVPAAGEYSRGFGILNQI